MPQYSCPIGVGWVTGWMPRYGHKSDPHTHAAEILIIASVRLMIFGMSRSSKRTSRGPYKTAPRMIYLLILRYFSRIVLNVRCNRRPPRARARSQRLDEGSKATGQRRRLLQADQVDRSAV